MGEGQAGGNLPGGPQRWVVSGERGLSEPQLRSVEPHSLARSVCISGAAFPRAQRTVLSPRHGKRPALADVTMDSSCCAVPCTPVLTRLLQVHP